MTYWIVKVNNYLNLLLENMLKLIVYLKCMTKINQLDLKHLCYDHIFVIIQRLWLKILMLLLIN